MAKDKAQKKMKKELYEWYKETMESNNILWNEASKILVNEYRISDIKEEKEIYDMLIGIEEEDLREIRWELDKDYKGWPMV